MTTAAPAKLDFYTPEYLGFVHDLRKTITEPDIRQWLTTVRTALLDGTIPAEQFTMETVLSSCNTVGCIAGWAGLLYKYGTFAVPPSPLRDFVTDFAHVAAIIRYAEYGVPALRDLFYNDTAVGSTASAIMTPALAAQAIENYLTTGEARWEEILLAAGLDKDSL